METLLRTGDHSNVIEELRSVPPDSKLLPKAQFVASLAKRQLSEKASEISGKEKLLLDALELHDSILKSAVARPAGGAAAARRA